MVLPWQFFEPALDGLFGVTIKRVMRTAVVAIVILGLFWRAPEIWLVHGLSKWEAHELREQLRHLPVQPHRQP
jgi:hypothetical protein